MDATDRPSAMRVRRIAILGHNDQLTRCAKPQVRPKWMTPEDFAALPRELLVRELRYRIEQPGRRTREVLLMTTLTDPLEYPAAELAALYGQRWQVEVNLRHLKSTLKMAVLKGKSPAVVERELLAYLLVYNLVQQVIHEAARRQQVAPERISFVDAVRWVLSARPGEDLPTLVVHPLRPGRFEPRVRKRRNNGYSYMTKPRAILKAMLTRGEEIGCK